jgi:hypothetical protein
MGRLITIRLTGLAEKFVSQMEKEGLTEADIIAQGIGLLEEVWRTKRVALVKEEFFRKSRFTNESEKVLEHYFHIQTPKSMEQEKDNNSASDINYGIVSPGSVSGGSTYGTSSSFNEEGLAPPIS